MIGWDIGGVNTKVARVAAGRVLEARGRPFEVQRAPDALVPLLRELAADIHQSPLTATHAVTMTAELSQAFRTKREGVVFVLDAMTAAFPGADVRIFTVDGRFTSIEEACRHPLQVAAANWAATAWAVARLHPDALLVDIGTTSTDIIPIVAGSVAAAGLTDPDRLGSGELVYTGAVRTPAEALASCVPYGAGTASVSAEGFALSGDVHVWRGRLAPEDYTVPTPDGRPRSREFVRERLARVVCADREMLNDGAISAIADALAQAQVERVAAAIRQVLARHPSLTTAVVTGLGAFIASAAARAAGLHVVSLRDEIGDAAARCAPAASVALLLERVLTERSAAPMTGRTVDAPRRVVVDAVIKLGGGVLASPGHFEAALSAIAAAARGQRVLVVPGGGPFADAVRDADRTFEPGDSAAHWMAVLAMDQHAHLIAARLRGGAIVTTAGEAAAALAAGSIPVLAPYRWLRDADPLPHSWDVTSDSIAAWVAGAIGARRLVLVKPPGASGDGTVDAYFARALPAPVTAEAVTADRIEAFLAVPG